MMIFFFSLAVLTLLYANYTISGEADKLEQQLVRVKKEKLELHMRLKEAKRGRK